MGQRRFLGTLLESGWNFQEQRDMNTWTPLWNGIVESSVWLEPDYVRVIWITLLAIKDSDDVARGSAFQISRKANKTEAETIKALKILASPDKKRLEKQPHDGRRIKKVEDGWLILNGMVYRERVQDEMRKARWRRAQAAKRKRLRDGLDGRAASAEYKAREKRAVAAAEAGDNDLADRIAAGEA
jgi:hypothetical protein